MTRIGGGLSFSEQLLSELADMRFTRSAQIDTKPSAAETETKGSSFADHLKASINEVNAAQKEADKMGMDLASGKQEDIHETMLKATQADLSFSLFVQIRNKVIEAYQEVMRMPV